MYKLSTNSVLRIVDGTIIPIDATNRDYQVYLAWLGQGNTPIPADPLPITLTPSQQIILADGVDLATVTIAGAPNAQVDFAINGTQQSVQLDGSGKDVIELSSDTPNTTILVQAGTARAVIYAVEVPS